MCHKTCDELQVVVIIKCLCKCSSASSWTRLFPKSHRSNQTRSMLALCLKPAAELSWVLAGRSLWLDLCGGVFREGTKTRGGANSQQRVGGESSLVVERAKRKRRERRERQFLIDSLSKGISRLWRLV